MINYKEEEKLGYKHRTMYAFIGKIPTLFLVNILFRKPQFYTSNKRMFNENRKML